MEPRIIVCGLGRTGYQILTLLRQQGVLAVGISNSREPRSNCPPLPGPDLIIGNPQESNILIAAGIREAQTLILAGSDEATNLAILMQARILNPRIRIINRLFNASLGDRLDQTLPDHRSLSVSALAAPIFAFAAQGNRAIGQLRLFDQTWPIHEEFIDAHHPWQGRLVSELWDNRSRMLIYYLPGQGEMDLVSAVIGAQRLQVGDRLIVGTQPSIRTARKSLIQKGVKLLVSVRQFQRYARSTLFVALALLLTILVATLTYVGVDFRTSMIDALYFAVGMITGAGGNERVVETSAASIKLFTVIMMLVGAGVIGICYALLNDFILGTRFRQFWDAAWVPQRHHYVVCGLGGIGMQTVSQLCAQGHEVAIVEPDPNSRFLSTARSLKVPVIQGDANLAVTLKAANIRQARALLAVTSNDTINLEIALTAKGLAPKLPVVVRAQDPHFGSMVQQVFGFEMVLSPVDLVVPSFAAAALGGQILGSGMTANKLWIAIATLITPAHPFCNQSVREAAMAIDFVPLYLETRQQTVHGWELLETRLGNGDVLYLTIPATRIEQLWRPSTGVLKEVADFA